MKLLFIELEYTSKRELWDFPDGSVVKNPLLPMQEDSGSNPSEKIPHVSDLQAQ